MKQNKKSVIKKTLPPKKEHPKEKPGLHPLNRHRERYDFKALTASLPELAPYVKLNEYGDESIDFFDPEAVKMLNKALLKHFYGIDSWDLPENYLCPPIPGRADYIHHIAELLGSCNNGKIPTGNKVVCLDIGVGANCIYPIIGNKEYGWSFIGTDIDSVALASAKRIVEENGLSGSVEILKQHNPKDFFRGILKTTEQIDLSICNPPFHSSPEEAQSGSIRKLRNLKQEKITKPVLNFGGRNNELWCDGGEEKFVKDMIFQSRQYADSCLWFSTVISKQANLNSAYRTLKTVEAVEVKTIPMSHGNKNSRIVAWTFFSKEEQKNWAQENW